MVSGRGTEGEGAVAVAVAVAGKIGGGIDSCMAIACCTGIYSDIKDQLEAGASIGRRFSPASRVAGLALAWILDA